MLLTNETHGTPIHSFTAVIGATGKLAFFLCTKKKKIMLDEDFTLKQGFLML